VTGPGEQVPAHGGQQVRAGERALGDGIEHGEAGIGTGGAAVRHGAVDLHDRAGCGLGQYVVEVRDGAPVGVFGRGGAGMLRRDRRLQVVPTDRLPAGGEPLGALQRRQTAPDQQLVPESSVLVVEQHRAAFGVEAGSTT
jgi:hypothetical protein